MRRDRASAHQTRCPERAVRRYLRAEVSGVGHWREYWGYWDWVVDLLSSWGLLCATSCAVSGKGRITRLCLSKPPDSYFICHESGNTWPRRGGRSERRVASSLTPRISSRNGVYADFYSIILLSSFVGVGDFPNLPIAQRSGMYPH